MDKSLFSPTPRVNYALEHSCGLHPIQKKLIESTLKHPMKQMIGAPEVLQTCTTIFEMLKAKNVLDVGLFTGASALAWALALPEDGRVISMDVSDDAYNKFGKQFVQESGVAHKIDIRIQPAEKTLRELIADGRAGTFDFAFIDADKTGYPTYYELCLQLLRSGGVIAVDNVLWDEKVLDDKKDEDTAAIDSLNKKAVSDPRVRNVMLSIADGLNIIVKK